MADIEDNNSKENGSLNCNESDRSDSDVFEDSQPISVEDSQTKEKVGIKQVNVDDPSCSELDIFEIAVEVQPDSVLESDLVPASPEILPFVRPRVYLEREPFTIQTVDVVQSGNASLCFVKEKQLFLI